MIVFRLTTEKFKDDLSGKGQKYMEEDGIQ